MSHSRLKITNGPLEHARFVDANEVFGKMCLSSPIGMVLALVGPTQVGKTIVLERISAELQADAMKAPSGLIPFIHLQIESVSEGRVKGKWLDLQLLKQLQHPVYMHIGDLDEREHYAPSRGRDEGSLRNALKSALNARKVIKTALDEAHLLTRTMKGDFRGNILESLKSLSAIDRTLILCGGYELAYMGLFDNAHFAGRTIIYDFAAYESTPEDLHEWARILKSFGDYLPLSPRTLLVQRAETILRAANGSIGLLEKWLWACNTYAVAKRCPVDFEVLRMWAPSVNEQKVIANDIKRGKEALARLPTIGPTSASKSVSQLQGTSPSQAAAVSPIPKNTRKPFERSPKRTETADLEIYIDD